MTDEADTQAVQPSGEAEGLAAPDAALVRLAVAELQRQAETSYGDPHVHDEFGDWNGTVLVDGSVGMLSLARVLALGVLHLPDDRPEGGETERVLVQHGVPARYSMGRCGRDPENSVRYWVDDYDSVLVGVVCWWALPLPLSAEQVAERVAMAAQPRPEPAAPEEPAPYECPKCGALSGDSWASCEGACPIVGSPYYDAATALRGILRRSYNRDK